MRLLRTSLLMLALLAGPVAAQTVTGNASLSVTGSSSNVAIPGSTGPYVSIRPAPASTQEVFYALGTDNTVAATTSSAGLPSGGTCLAVGPNTYVAAITATSTATLRITRMTLCPNF